MDFRFELPHYPKGPLLELSPEQMEKHLLKNLDHSREDPVQALWQLAHFYKGNRKHDKAMERLGQLLPLLPDPEAKAECVFTMGQVMEQSGDYPAAIRYYKEAFSLEPTNHFTWYFINNNLGFAFNTLGQYDEGELYCRRAIEIDPKRSNGFKNLGIALAAKGQNFEAARAFIKATQVNAADQRPLLLLEDLMKQHPELEFDFKDDLIACQAVVQSVALKVEEAHPRVYRGWKKDFILLWVKIKRWFR